MPAKISSDKKHLRRKSAKKRNALLPALIKAKSRSIQRILFKTQQFRSAKNILFYVSFRSEVFTHGMIKDSILAGKKVMVPVTDLKRKKLRVSYIRNFNRDLEPSTYGILEPKKKHFRPVPYGRIDLVLVPGLAFDLKGNRIGYGGGYYDRLLSKIPAKTPTMALCFETQVFRAVPAARNDRKVKMIITEKRAYNIS